jgi:hypothetical protein
MKLISLLPIALAGSLAVGSLAGESRGIQNNNPGNIRTNFIDWKGAIGHDGAFVKFATPEDGIRAIARILRVYDSKGINTPATIIERWAPPSENKTDKYVTFVAKKLNKKVDEKISIDNNQTLALLVSAIIEYENGSLPYSNETIMRGITKP